MIFQISDSIISNQKSQQQLNNSSVQSIELSQEFEQSQPADREFKIHFKYKNSISSQNTLKTEESDDDNIYSINRLFQSHRLFQSKKLNKNTKLNFTLKSYDRDKIKSNLSNHDSNKTPLIKSNKKNQNGLSFFSKLKGRSSVYTQINQFKIEQPQDTQIVSEFNTLKNKIIIPSRAVLMEKKISKNFAQQRRQKLKNQPLMENIQIKKEEINLVPNKYQKIIGIKNKQNNIRKDLTKLESQKYPPVEKQKKQQKKIIINPSRLCINCENYVNLNSTKEHEQKCVGFKIILKMSPSELIDYLNQKIQKKIIDLQKIKNELESLQIKYFFSKIAQLNVEKKKVNKVLQDLNKIRLNAMKKLRF